MLPAANPRKVSAMSGAPDSDMRAASSGAVSCGPISISRCSSISPVSIPASIRIVVTPVRVSPFTMAQLMGAAPRYLGSREACKLRSEEHTSELQSHLNLVCRLLLEKKNSDEQEGLLFVRGRRCGVGLYTHRA